MIAAHFIAHFIALFIATAAPGVLASQEPPPLVSTEWLAERLHLEDERIVLLHVGNEASWTEGRVPGARLMPPASFAPEVDGLSTEMPDPDALAAALEAAGVTNDSRIVVYAATSPPTLAARLWITLEHFGLGARTSILDGGLLAWRTEGRPTETGAGWEATAPLGRGALELGAPRDLLADHAFVRERLQDPGFAIVDARDPQFWTGEERNQQRAARAGRIPGARNLPFRSLVDESGRLLEPEALRALFSEAGVEPGQPLVAYCHVGIQASLLFLAARRLGYEVRLYDGSYEDWSRRAELPVETGPGR